MPCRPRYNSSRTRRTLARTVSKQHTEPRTNKSARERRASSPFRSLAPLAGLGQSSSRRDSLRQPLPLTGRTIPQTRFAARPPEPHPVSWQASSSTRLGPAAWPGHGRARCGRSAARGTRTALAGAGPASPMRRAGPTERPEARTRRSSRRACATDEGR